jgi:photosystem II stability/assembly factor-like uncharacterized protein
VGYTPREAQLPGGILLESEDSGRTWKELLRVAPLGDSAAGIVQVAVFKNTVMVATAQSGKSVLEVSRDGGRSFDQTQIESPLVGVTLGDEEHAYLVAGETMASSTLLSSGDAGRTWNAVTRADRAFWYLQFVNSSRGYAFFDAGQGAPTALRVTADGGHSWHDVKTVPEGMVAGKFGAVVTGLAIAPDGTAYVLCSDGLYIGRV